MKFQTHSTQIVISIFLNEKIFFADFDRLLVHKINYLYEISLFVNIDGNIDFNGTFIYFKLVLAFKHTFTNYNRNT